EIWSWFESHKRTLPWRDLPDTDLTGRAYKTLVSEIMLQQTQVPRVIITFKNFLERFPTLRDLAGASNKEVLMAWRGMGYNSRALRLRDAARKVVGISSGSLTRLLVNSYAETRVNELTNQRVMFPTSMDDLTSIPGIGPYTAAAIRNFAFGLPTPCIDTNIRRILHRTFVGPENPDGTWEKDDQYLLEIASEVVEEALRQKGKRSNRSKQGKRGSSVSSFPSFTLFASEWHAALMDFGSLVQTKRNPKWDICPLTREGIMKTTRKNYELRITNYGKKARTQSLKKREPGRAVGSVFIPNRIFRGRVIEALRDAPKGLTLHDIGAQIAIDWDSDEHHDWLSGILAQLVKETMLGCRKGRYVLG
ncbi:MAG: hypothetical protein HOO67_03550, partial [Candidatus Peribacteraceae bacterium]|nr:hypothetical protein [Candidatus Peribacteraceae bacterium]